MPLPTRPNPNEDDGKKRLPLPTEFPKPGTDDSIPLVAPPKHIGRNLDDTLKGTFAQTKRRDFQENEYLLSDITVEEATELNYDKVFKHLQDKILEVKTWLQEHITENQLTERVANARTNRGPALAEVKGVLSRILTGYFIKNPAGDPQENNKIIGFILNEILGYGPIEPLFSDPTITEIMVNGPKKVYFERKGKISLAKGVQFRDKEHLLELCQQMLQQIGRVLDLSHPKEDGRLPDGSRINATHWIIGPSGPFLTIRRFPEEIFSFQTLLDKESITPEMAEEIGNLIYHKSSTIISGGTGSGKQLPLTTKIPTPTGMTTMGDLKVGDYVLDENGKPTKVTAKYSSKVPEAYKITFSDGNEVVADADHNWYTSTRSARRAVSRTENRKTEFKRKLICNEEELNLLQELVENYNQPVITLKEIITVVPVLKNVVLNTVARLQPVGATKAEGSNQKTKLYEAEGLLNTIWVKANTFVSDQRHKQELEQVRTTKEILDTLVAPSGHTNHAVRLLSQPVQYPEKDLPITPYLLGAWIGDGYSKSGQICGIDEEVFSNIQSEGHEFTSVKQENLRPDRTVPLTIVTVRGLMSALRKIGLLKIKTVGVPAVSQKTIPDDYLYASEKQRRALLAGLLDTDGTVAKKGTVEFTTTIEELALKMRQLVQSLGYKATLYSKIPTYTYKGEKKKGNRAYTVSFNAKDEVFGISRKQEMHRKASKEQQGHRNEWRYITKIEPVESVPMACITVDSLKSLYLITDAFIPTHNTSMLNALSGCIPLGERIVTIEDSLELRLHPDRHVVPLEARKSLQGENSTATVTIRDLVVNALRMKPNRIVVGEVRDSTALDMLQAFNTGHEGSLSTIHSNNPRAAIERLSNLVAQAGELDSDRALALIASSVDIIIQVAQYEDGSRRVSEIVEIPSRVTIQEGKFTLEPITLWEYEQTGYNDNGDIVGHYKKVNDLSEEYIKSHRLDRRKHLSLVELLEVTNYVTKSSEDEVDHSQEQ